MPELLFQPKNKSQLAWLLAQAAEQGIPYREYVRPKKIVPTKSNLIKEFSQAAQHAKMIADGQMEGKNAYDLLNEL